MCDVLDPDTPTKPVATNIEQTSVTLSWQPGESRTINSTSIRYRKSSTGGNWASRLVPRSSGDDEGRSRRNVDEVREFMLDGLEPATEYIVHVVVESFGKISLSPAASFETREFCVCFCTAAVTRNFHCTCTLHTSAMNDSAILTNA